MVEGDVRSRKPHVCNQNQMEENKLITRKQRDDSAENSILSLTIKKISLSDFGIESQTL